MITFKQKNNTHNWHYSFIKNWLTESLLLTLAIMQIPKKGIQNPAAVNQKRPVRNAFRTSRHNEG